MCVYACASVSRYTLCGSVCMRALQYLLHDVQDIERKYRAILHGSTTDYTAASVCGQTTVKRSRINGGKHILSLIYFVV